MVVLDAEVKAMVEKLERDAELVTMLVAAITEIQTAEDEVTDSVTQLRLARAKAMLREVYRLVIEGQA